MAKATRSRLTEVRVRTATAGDAKHGRQLFDGLGSNGLYLHVTPAGAKCWVQQLMVPNAATGKSRRVRIGLGAWPRVTLAEARKAAFANRCLRDEGRDPLAAKRQRAHETAKEARVPTFASAIDEVIALRRPTWKDADDTLAGQFRASLERYAGALGPIQVSRVAMADVMQVLAPHWHSVPAAADTARRRINTVLQWAIGQGYRSDDPAAKRAVAAALGAQTHRTEHHRAMSYAEVGRAVAAVHARSRCQITKLTGRRRQLSGRRHLPGARRIVALACPSRGSSPPDPWRVCSSPVCSCARGRFVPLPEVHCRASHCLRACARGIAFRSFAPLRAGSRMPFRTARGIALRPGFS